MCFCYILPHFNLRFAAKHTAFWCILHCILVQNTLRFGAKCKAFWCKMRGVLLLNALQNLAIRLRFLVVADANLGEFSSKRNAKA